MEFSVYTKKHNVKLTFNSHNDGQLESDVAAAEEIANLVDNTIDELYDPYLEVIEKSPFSILEMIEPGTNARQAMLMATEQAVKMVSDGIKKVNLSRQQDES